MDERNNYGETNTVILCKMSVGYDLTNEDDIKEYAKNLSIEYRFSCYHEKRPEGCHLFGDYLESIEQDFAHALKVYLLNCDEHDYAKSCYKYAAYRQLGRGSTRDDGVAFKYFEKGCNLNEPQSCLLAGAIATTSNNKSIDAEQEKSIVAAGGRDYVKGMDFLRKGCLANNAEACHRASSLCIIGHERIAKDMTMAFDYATRACQMGHAFSCTNLSLMYRKGEGTEKNDILAEKFKKLAEDIRDQHVKKFNQIEFGKS